MKQTSDEKYRLCPLYQNNEENMTKMGISLKPVEKRKIAATATYKLMHINLQ